MTTARRLLMTLALLTALAGTALAQEVGDPVPFASLPEPVQTTVRKQGEKAKIRSIVKEIEDGRDVFEVSMKVAGLGRDMIIAPDGEVLVAEDEVKMASIPAPVREGFMKQAGKGKYRIIESVTLKGVLTFYEGQLHTGKKIAEIQIGLDGQPVPPEAMK